MTEEKIDRTVHDLLAIIHRDGGHYEEDNGHQAALNEACRMIPAERQLWEGIYARAFQKGMETAGKIAMQQALSALPVPGEVDALVAKIKLYEAALKRIAEGYGSPRRLAHDTLHGEELAAQGIVRG